MEIDTECNTNDDVPERGTSPQFTTSFFFSHQQNANGMVDVGCSPINPPGGLDQRECPDAGRVLAKLQTNTLRAESPVSPGGERHRGYLTPERDGNDERRPSLGRATTT